MKIYGYIYLTENLINHKKYIGQHKAECFDEKYYGSGKILKRAIKKYGLENFSCKIIQACIDEKDLNESEEYWIKYYNATESEDFYNISSGGAGCRIVGIKRSDECKLKHSIISKKQWANAEYKETMIKKLYEARKNSNYIVSDETRKKMSDAHKGKHNGINNPMYGKIGELNPNYGKKRTVEEKKLISEKAKERYKNPKNNPMYGKHHTEETKQKISDKKKGSKMSDEQKQKISSALAGKKKRPYKKRKYHCICKKCNNDFLGNSHNQKYCENCKEVS